MGLTSEKTLNEVQKLFDKFFDLNSLLDRHVYLLDIKWNLPAYQNYVHKSLSHQMPLYSDIIQEFGSLRGDLFYRGQVPMHNEMYATVYEMTEAFVMELAETEKLCANAIKEAIANGDLMYEDFMRDFQIKYIAPLTKQAVVFYNAIKEYETTGNLMKWNKDFESYIIKVGE